MFALGLSFVSLVVVFFLAGVAPSSMLFLFLLEVFWLGCLSGAPPPPAVGILGVHLSPNALVILSRSLQLLDLDHPP